MLVGGPTGRDRGQRPGVLPAGVFAQDGEDLVDGQEEQVVPVAGGDPGAEHERSEHPEHPDELRAHLFAAARGPAPPLEVGAQAGGPVRVLLGEPLPRRAANLFSSLEEGPRVMFPAVQTGELVVAPAGVLDRSGRGDLELARSAMAVALDVGLPVDLAAVPLGQPQQRPEAGPVPSGFASDSPTQHGQLLGDCGEGAPGEPQHLHALADVE